MHARWLWVALGLVGSVFACGDDGDSDLPPVVVGGMGGASGAAAGGASGGTAGSAGMAGRAGSSGSTGMAMAGRGTGGRSGNGGAGRGESGNGAGGRAGSGMAGTMGMAGGAAGSGCAQNLRCKLTAPASTGDVHQDCVDRINQFRTECACLPPLARWTEGEACADMMAEYDSSRPNAHAGFMDRICMGGSAQNECPGWRSNEMIVSGCLQSMWDEGPPPMQPCDGQCFQTYGHFINMSNTRFTKVACGFFTTSNGRIWSVQNFSR